MIFDHPFVGEAANAGYLLNLDEYLSEADRACFAADSLGDSWQSYAYAGGIWALPIDAAAQTAAWRPDLMNSHKFEVPVTLEDVFSLAKEARAAGLWVGWPAKPTDLMCTFMSVSASMGSFTGADVGPFIQQDRATEVISKLKRLSRVVHPKSRSWDPITCLDYMSVNDEVFYSPYTFNYVNYATHAVRPLRFGMPPLVELGRPVRALLGGAGIGINANCAHPRAAFDYASYLCSVEFQSDYYVREGGQPASRAAWLSEQCNVMTNGFFRDTFAALDAAFVRPTHPGFVPFFREATLRLDDVVFNDAPILPFVTWLNSVYDQLRPAEMKALVMR